MNRPYISLAITAVALAFAAAQFNAASATPQIRRAAPLQPRPDLQQIDPACAKGFATAARTFPGKGHIYECKDRMTIRVECKNGYTPNHTLSVHRAWNGNGWNVQFTYSCFSQPH